MEDHTQMKCLYCRIINGELEFSMWFIAVLIIYVCKHLDDIREELKKKNTSNI